MNKHTKQKELPEAAEPVDAYYGSGTVFIIGTVVNHQDKYSKLTPSVL